MLPFRVIRAIHPRQTLVSSSRRVSISYPLPSKSHGIISFADPHSLTPIESYPYKNIGGRGRRSDVLTFRPSDVPYPPKSFSCNTYKKPGGGGILLTSHPFAQNPPCFAERVLNIPTLQPANLQTFGSVRGDLSPIPPLTAHDSPHYILISL